jgi:hypothetical protein
MNVFHSNLFLAHTFAYQRPEIFAHVTLGSERAGDPASQRMFLHCFTPVVQLPPDYARIFKLANAQQSAAVAKKRVQTECFE